jgi:hypothetical protein
MLNASRAPRPCRDAGLLPARSRAAADLAEEFLLVAARALERALDHAVALRVQRAEAQVFQFQLDVVQAQPLGHRRVDVERLARDRAARRRRHRADGAHVVRAVGELDHDHAQVAHHRQQHLAEALGLRFLAVLELDLVELGDAVDDLGHIRAETLRDVFLRDRRVFDDVVQDGADNGVGVQVQVGEDFSRGERVGDVGFAREALLALVGFGAELRGSRMREPARAGRSALPAIPSGRRASDAWQNPGSEDA